ncbi:MAG: hypothetical protein HDT18_10040 [Oscillibacter sp.]|nr:hypothetical protein [Oscillibacter sp.]
MKFQKKADLQTLVQRAMRLANSHEVILLTSNKEKTNNQVDYTGYSVKSEFFSEEEEARILNSLYRIGFSVRQFYNEEDFIAFVSEGQQNLSKKIVINSAQKGTKIGRKSLIPAVCDLFGISYVGSDPYVVSLCRDKYRCGCILAQNGIPVPDAWLYQPVGGWFYEPPTMAGRLIVKPNYEAASIGIDATNICNASTMPEKVRQLEAIYHQEILAEQFIAGYEVEIPVITVNNVPTVFFPVGINLNNDKKMGERILDYQLRDVDAYEYYDFSIENPQVAKVALETAAKTAQILNIKGFGRVDLRISESGSIYVTDIATNPHYTDRSSYEFLFDQLGFSYDDLIACLIAASIGEGK